MTKRELSCPSTSASDPDAAVFGIVSGTAREPDLIYLEQPVALSELPLPPDVPAAEMYRLVGSCAQRECGNWTGSRCRLGQQIAHDLPVVVDSAPPCSIRRTCRWFAEEGVPACLRCPQVVTHTHVPLREQARRAKRQLPVV
ncbi:MAG TPA: hypothetical protein VFX59_13800 [Polyangiales bacterium]|nr:hypothetical protein [Polyangiales bacterium]